MWPMAPLVGLLLTAISVAASACWSAEQLPAEPADQPLEVELFSAIADRQLDVRVTANNYHSLTVRVRNLTPHLLKVQLPRAVGAMPVDRWQAIQRLEAAGANLTDLTDGYGYGQEGSQGLGGYLGGGNSDPRHAAGEPKPKRSESPARVATTDGHWTVRPGGRFELRIPAFCLEYGKPDPSKKIPYTICPLRYVNHRPIVSELIERFGLDDWDQRASQLALWHVANGLSWEVLSQLRFPPMPGRARNVTSEEITLAERLAQSLPSYNPTTSLGGGH
ncbi:MAG: hypothetical protein FJ276_09145 [Planctomycetes bacterium]|nr:hypothetical protein [Planctomycetota bacterium]